MHNIQQLSVKLDSVDYLVDRGTVRPWGHSGVSVRTTLRLNSDTFEAQHLQEWPQCLGKHRETRPNSGAATASFLVTKCYFCSVHVVLPNGSCNMFTYQPLGLGCQNKVQMKWLQSAWHSLAPHLSSFSWHVTDLTWERDTDCWESCCRIGTYELLPSGRIHPKLQSRSPQMAFSKRAAIWWLRHQRSGKSHELPYTCQKWKARKRLQERTVCLCTRAGRWKSVAWLFSRKIERCDIRGKKKKKKNVLIRLIRWSSHQFFHNMLNLKHHFIL